MGAVNVIQVENANVFSVNIDNHEGLYFESMHPDDMNTVTWVDSKSNIQFQIDANASKIDILHMANSCDLVKVNKK